MFRASHRKEYGSPPQGHPRARASLPGEPFHSFTQADAQHMPQAAAVLCRFQMLPTAYTFAKVICLLLLLLLLLPLLAPCTKSHSIRTSITSS